MTAEQIRALIASSSVAGNSKEDQETVEAIRLVALVEIAAQLAEMNGMLFDINRNLLMMTIK